MRSLGHFVLLLLSAASVVSCGTTRTSSIPNTGTILPNASFQLTPSVAYTVEQIAMAGVAGGIIYLVYDPLAPNWRIEETRLGDETYSFSLRAKSFRVGGDGEAMQVVRRRALELQRKNGFAAYKVLAYSEGVESSTPLTQRVAEGRIQLLKTPPAVVR